MSAPVLLDLARRATWPPPVAARLDVFERLPSQYEHPSRCARCVAQAALASFGASGTAVWHRYRSRILRAEQPLLARPLPTMLPADLLRLALLEPAALSRLARAGGVVLLAPGIGATIARDAVAALRRALGEPLYQFAIHAASAHHPGIAASRAWCAAEGATGLVAQVDPLGWSLIDAALEAADPAVLARVALKRALADVARQAPTAGGPFRAANESVPAADTRTFAVNEQAPATTTPVPTAADHTPAAGNPPPFPALTAGEALALTDTLISHFEPAWFSSFNAIR